MVKKDNNKRAIGLFICGIVVVSYVIFLFMISTKTFLLEQDLPLIQERMLNSIKSDWKELTLICLGYITVKVETAFIKKDKDEQPST